MKKIEQLHHGLVVFDCDTVLSRSEISAQLVQDFRATGTGNPYVFDFDGRTYTLLVKQVTYLGHPHLEFKKRIQIPSSWRDWLQQPNTLLVGLYRYQKTVIYVFFDTSQYAQRQLNNSSAHVHTIDLQKAQEYGIFTKTDMGGNIITVVAQSHIHNYLMQLSRGVSEHSAELKLFDDFKASLTHTWQGINCYQEMIRANYNNKFQPEWAGFYLEFRFEGFLKADVKRNQICQKVSNKRLGEIDLDLRFHPNQTNEFFGDLKAHSEISSEILGNDSQSIENALSSYGKIWYVVLIHDTEKDSAHDFVTTRFWNKAQNKEDEMSYSSRMKFAVCLKHLKILEINRNNQIYLNESQKGWKNSNGKPRPPKISIPKTSINNFLIYQSSF